ncbi:MAG: hypothetical protein QOI27_661 [Gaiellaceae bacterium]|nr:hypothetical protein [Gaiellaceae bacterium]
MSRLSTVVCAACLALLVAAVAAGPAPAGSRACGESNPPNTLVLVGGSGQTSKLGQPFQSSFQVALANTNGCPVTGPLAGTNIAFVAPTSGATGAFASTGTTVAVVGTGANGTATAPTFTANDTAGTYTVRAESDYGNVTFSVTNTASGVVASIAATGGALQTATVNGRYADPLVAVVLDADGRPVQGASVAFVLAPNPYGAGASFVGGGAQATATTNASGIATSPAIVANSTPGRFSATAAVAGLPAVATFELDNHAAATAIAAVAASASATVGTRYAEPLQATVLDASGQPIEGIGVTFTLTAAHGGAGATFLGGAPQATVYADANGRATSPPVVANATAGAFTATASAVGSVSPASYTLRNRAAAPHAVAAGAASTQSAQVGARFAVRLVVTVTDIGGNPVAGVVVRFAAPGHGASGTFGTGHRRLAQVKTNADGIAVAPFFEANDTPGGYAVRATVAGTGHSAAFALVNRSQQ